LPDAQVQEIYAPLKERYIALQARLAEHFNEEQA
jgi:hypothetical protein